MSIKSLLLVIFIRLFPATFSDTRLKMWFLHNNNNLSFRFRTKHIKITQMFADKVNDFWLANRRNKQTNKQKLRELICGMTKI